MAFPTTSVIDNFNRADAANLGANWSTFWGDPTNTIVTNQAVGSTGWRGNYYNVGTYGPDCEAYLTLTALGATYTFYLFIRTTSTSPLTGYAIKVESALSRISLKRYLNGSEAEGMAAYTQAVTAGDSIGISCIGSTITGWYKSGAGAWTELGHVTNTYITNAGYICLDHTSTTTANSFDNFGGGTAITTKTYTETGSAVSVLSGTGTDQVTFTDAGSAVSVLSGTGADDYTAATPTTTGGGGPYRYRMPLPPAQSAPYDEDEEEALLLIMTALEIRRGR